MVTPPGSEQFYTEQPVFLPHTHYVADNTQAIAADVPRRRDCGLPDDGFVFCCFNLCSKIEPEMFDVWMRILSKVPGSVLWLLSDMEVVHHNLRCEAERRGIAGDRIVFGLDHLSSPVELYSVSLDGSDVARITGINDDHVAAARPVAPFGRRSTSIR